MSKIAVVTDSGSDISPSQAAKSHLKVVPLIVRFGTEEYVDQQDISPEEFYQKMSASAELPATSTPSQGVFEETFRELAAGGVEDIICVNLSYKLSATGQVAQSAAEKVTDEVRVHCVDSLTVSVGLGTIAIQAAMAAEAGQNISDVLKLVDDLKGRTKLYGVLNTLENLQKGGRIGKARAMLGSALSIKPIVEVKDGEVEEAHKPRTRHRAFLWMRDQVLKDRMEAGEISHLAVGHAAADDFEDFCEVFSEEFNLEGMRDNTIGPIIGTHAGSGIVGLSYVVGPPRVL